MKLDTINKTHQDIKRLWQGDSVPRGHQSVSGVETRHNLPGVLRVSPATLELLDPLPDLQ